MRDLWTARRKLRTLERIDAGLMTAETIDRYGLSAEELAAWRRDYAAHGLAGLRATRVQNYRRARSEAP